MIMRHIVEASDREPEVYDSLSEARRAARSLRTSGVPEVSVVTLRADRVAQYLGGQNEQ